jgi:hypothetical protein
LVITIETTAVVVGCASCGVRAQAHDRMPIEIRDLACFGGPVRLVWTKRRWRCRDELCDAKTWTRDELAIGVHWRMWHLASLTEPPATTRALSQPPALVVGQQAPCACSRRITRCGPWDDRERSSPTTAEATR